MTKGQVLAPLWGQMTSWILTSHLTHAYHFSYQETSDKMSQEWQLKNAWPINCECLYRFLGQFLRVGIFLLDKCLEVDLRHPRLWIFKHVMGRPKVPSKIGRVSFLNQENSCHVWMMIPTQWYLLQEVLVFPYVGHCMGFFPSELTCLLWENPL